MAEQGKGTSANRNEKKLLLDEDLGKDFLGSWKSLSVTEDETMDFSFGTVSKGKKKTFDFDKLDMDFNLDADFDKLSSFKVDMPDLDFPCSPKKSSKSKEVTEDDSSNGKRQRKQDDFSFNFDFNDVDFTCSLKTGKRSVDKLKSFNRELTINEPVLPRDEGSADSRNKGEGFNCDDGNSGGKPVVDTRSQDKQVALVDKRSQDKQVVQDESAALGCEITAGEDSLVNDVLTRGTLLGNTMTLAKNSTDDESVSSESNFDTDDMQTKSESVVNLMSTTMDSTEGESVLLRNEKHVKNLNEIGEVPKSSGFTIGSKLIGDATHQDQQVAKATTGVHMEFCSAANDREDPDSSASEVRGKLDGDASPHDHQVTNIESLMLGNDESTGADFDRNASQTGNKLAVPKSLSRELTGEPIFQRSELKLGNFTDSGKSINSVDAQNGKNIDYKSRAQDKETEKGESVLLRIKSSSSSKKGTLTSYQANENSKSTAPNMETIQTTKNLSVEGAKTRKIISDVSGLKSLRSIGANKDLSSSTLQGKSCSFRNLEPYTKLAGNMTSSVACSVGSNEKQKPVTISLKRKNSEELNTALMSLKPLKRISESPKDNRTIKESLDSLKPLTHLSESPKENRMFKESLDSMKPLTSLSKSPKEKRMFKESLDTLKPLKRLSNSPKENTMLKGSLDGTVQEEVSEDGKPGKNKTKNLLLDHSTTGPKVSEEVSMIDAETLLVAEEDENVLKAEMYTKQLDEICNMLKKKYEEAKELLVRATVNNNYLLMLNHPIHEEKITMIQKFASQLVLNDIPR